MQCGVEGIIELLVIFIRKKTFPITFFCNLVIGKSFLFSSGKVEGSVIFCPALHKAPFRYGQAYGHTLRTKNDI